MLLSVLYRKAAHSLHWKSYNTEVLLKMGRLYQLDALRGIAALMVVVFHFFYHYDSKYGHSFAVFEWVRLGKTGVYLFFIISGFVIFWTLSRSDRPMDFIFSRFSRLYPPFWVAVILTFSFTSLIGPENRVVSWEALVANLTMFHEYFGYPHVDGVYWTLSIELAFYILSLLAFFLGLLRFADSVCLAWLSISFFSALSGLDFGILDKVLLLKYNLLFVLGIAFYRYWSGQGKAMPLLCISLSIVLAFVRFPLDEAVTIVIWVGLFSMVISGRLMWLNQSLLIWLGSISYSLYLIHQNIGYGIIELGYRYDLTPLISITFALLVSFLGAQIITSYVERPSLALLRSWYKDRKKSIKPGVVDGV